VSDLGAHLIVKGLVQGVGYRWFTSKSASSHNLNGWVKNLPDSSVEVQVYGNKGAINSFIKELARGPSFSKVKDVVVRWIEFEPGHNSFSVEP